MSVGGPQDSLAGSSTPGYHDQGVAGLLALLALFVVIQHGGCSAVPSGPPPGAPPFASGDTGFTVTCGGGPELLLLARAFVLVAAAMFWIVLGLVLAQAITGRRLLPWHRQPLRPRLFALGVVHPSRGSWLGGSRGACPTPYRRRPGASLPRPANCRHNADIMRYAQPVSAVRSPPSRHLTRG